MSLAVSWWPLYWDDREDEAQIIGLGLAEFLQKPEPWKKDAACRGEDPAIFFPRQGQHSRKAKLICLSCVVREQCREYAERTGSEGIWSGEVRTQKVRSVQDARPVTINVQSRTGQDQAIDLQGFRASIASRKHQHMGDSPS